MTEWYARNGNKTMEGVKNGLKGEKTTIKQGLALERSKPIWNERSENISHHKRLRMSGRMHRPWQIHEQQTSFQRTQEVEHVQGLGTTNLYPANTGVVGHGLEVREGMVWWWVEGKAYSRVPAHILLRVISC